MQRLVGAEQRQLRGRMIRLVRAVLGMDRRARYRLHVNHLEPDLLRGLKTSGNQAIKKPA
jgi:hypothetical protein